MGQAHAAAVHGSGSRVAGVVDTDASRACALAERFGGQAFASVGQALDRLPGVDAAVIASPSHAHLAQSVELARAGIPALVEKPHRLPGQDPGPLRELLRASRTRYQVGMSTRYLPGMAAVAAAVGEGRLGQIAFCSDCIWFQLRPGALSPWYFSRRDSGGGVLLTNGVHALDRAAWLLGGSLRLRDAALDASSADACETTAELRLAGPAGALVTVSLLWSPFPVPPGRLVLVGEEGSATLHADGSYLIAAGSRTTHGEPAGPQTALARQWQAFCSGQPGPGLEDLEPTLALIESVYAAAG